MSSLTVRQRRQFEQRLLTSGNYQIRQEETRSIYYDERRPSPIMPATFIPPLKSGKVFDIQAGDFPVLTGGETSSGFIDRIKHNGLREYVVTPQNNKALGPVYLFDNDNHSIFGWLEAFHMGLIEKNALLIHIDAHDDLEVPPDYQLLAQLKKGLPDMAKAYQLAIGLWINEFIWPAFDFGLFSRMHSILTPTSMMAIGPRGNQRYDINKYVREVLGSLQNENRKRIVAAIDLDFTQGISGRVADLHLDMIRQIAKVAGVVTIATSPSCIEQRVAIERARQLVESLQSPPLIIT